ncbi:MAG TPA: DNA repair protein RecO [Rhizomicrobium sp.]|jgi:DNA repair protein RecO (recombination protein O)|nr:DNA repair protein RecO [Rhizomicrobium sp.]
MEWNDDAIALAARLYGETGAILEILTRERGRHLGLVHGGASRRLKSSLLTGNTLNVSWRARLSEHLGTFSVELRRERAGALLEHGDALVGLNAFAEVARVVLPEREPHETVFAAAEILLDAMAETDFLHWGALYVRWEAGLLDALGFGLDLGSCAVTGTAENLRYVSPKSGRAVSAEAGAPYHARLLPLPAFLRQMADAAPARADIADGLRLTGYFLRDRVLAPHHQPVPPARQRLDALAEPESS